MRLLFRLLAAAVLLMPSWAAAQPSAARTITVYGESSKEIVPNEAAVLVVITARQRELKRAKLEHDRKLESLFKIAGELQISRRDLKTQYASVQPVYRYQNQERVFEGYEVSSRIEVTVNEIDQVGILMQNLINADFENIGNVQYRVDNDLAYRDAALIEALDNARAKAKKLAERAEGQLGEVLTITQGQSRPEPPQPVMHGRAKAMQAEAMAGGATPPAGIVTITGTVTVTYELQ